MYEAIDDPYCYPGTTVLINKLDLRDQKKLDDFETEITAQRAAEPLPSGRLSYVQYRAIHRHLFQDIYDWAGKVRTVRISKGNSTFCYPENINKQMMRLFLGLQREKYLRGLKAKEFAARASHLLAEINAIHPFREGNGRTQLAFLTLLAEKAEHPLVLDRMRPAAMMDAMIASFDGSEAPLAQMIGELLENE
jgi:cell filamentation protein